MRPWSWTPSGAAERERGLGLENLESTEMGRPSGQGDYGWEKLPRPFRGPGP